MTLKLSSQRIKWSRSGHNNYQIDNYYREYTKWLILTLGVEDINNCRSEINVNFTTFPAKTKTENESETERDTETGTETETTET